MWGDEDSVSVLALDEAGRRVVLAEPNAAVFPEPPPPTRSEGRGGSSGRFRARLATTAPQIGGRPMWTLILDAADIYFGLNSSTKTRDARELLSILENQGASELLPELSQRGEYRWGVFNSTLEPITEGTDTSLILAGVPDELATSIEEWAKGQGGMISAIVPAPVAVMAWAAAHLRRQQVATAIVVAPLRLVTVRAIFSNGQLVQVDMDPHRSEYLLPEHFQEHIPTGHVPVYVWTRDSQFGSSGDPRVINLDQNRIAAFAGPLTAPQRDGSALQLVRGDFHVLSWVAAAA